MPPLEKHIADSLAEFDKRWDEPNWNWESELDAPGFYVQPGEDGDEPNWDKQKIKTFINQSHLQLLEIARGEVEKMQCLAEEQDNLVVRYVKRQDVLDTLTITEN